MTLAVEVHPPDEWADAAAKRILRSLPRSGAVVLTGGSTAREVYPKLASSGAPWAGIELYFSDERCVPPVDSASNYGVANRTLLAQIDPGTVYRMRGEDDPAVAARSYEAIVAPEVALGWDVLLLGMGEEGHVAGLFPGSEALSERNRLCVPVHRPDGLLGLTLTPPALTSSRRVLLFVSGASKSEAVRRAVAGDESPDSCPVRLFAEHPDATFLLDEPAAALL